MTNERVNTTPSVELSLLAQVRGKCPLCGTKSFYEKKARKYRNYEIAHIYPLNATSEEEELLKDQERLHENLNHPHNLIPLCKSCHRQFDTPRTIEEYQKLLALKKEFLQIEEQVELQSKYDIEREINSIIDSLYDEFSGSSYSPTDYNLKELDKKLDSSISNPTKIKIRHNIADYFLVIRAKFADLEKDQPSVSELIANQVKVYYINQKALGISRQAIFENLVEWLVAKANPPTRDFAEIVISYFVQNCEVFE